MCNTRMYCTLYEGKGRGDINIYEDYLAAEKPSNCIRALLGGKYKLQDLKDNSLQLTGSIRTSHVQWTLSI
jgi:hypothetical protein